MTDDILISAQDAQRMLRALQKIAAGRLDCGRPLPSYDAREVARQSLIAVSATWSKPMTEEVDMTVFSVGAIE